MSVVRLVILSTAIAGADGELPVGLPAIYDAIEQTASYAQDVVLVPRSEVLSSGLDYRVRACGADINCTTTALTAQRIDRALFLVVNSRATPALITFRALEVKTRRELATRTTLCDRGCDLEATLRSDARAILEAIGHRMRGRLIVETIPPEASVAIEPSSSDLRSGAGAYHLPPGRYAVRASLDDYVETATVATVIPQRETLVHLRLEPEPGLTSSPLFWGTIVGVVVLGAATALAVSYANARKDFFFCPDIEPGDCGPR